MPDEEFRPGAHDLETPFIFVPHGAPDPVEFKRKYPGWVSFPATFVPHPKPIPKWKIINGQRWPLDKRGRPWPKTRYGRPTCPFDELPPGFPAPGTQYELLRKLENPMLFFGDEPMPTVAEFSELAARLRAERAAAAPPPPVQRPKAYDGDGLGPARDYLAAMARVDQQLREFAASARQEKAAAMRQQSAAVRDVEPLAFASGTATPQSEREQETVASPLFQDTFALHVTDAGLPSLLQSRAEANAASPVLTIRAIAAVEAVANDFSAPIIPRAEAVGSSDNPDHAEKTPINSYADATQVKERDQEDRTVLDQSTSQTHDADGLLTGRPSESENGQVETNSKADSIIRSTSTLTDRLIQCTM